MQIGLIGLGKMGFNLGMNMHRHKHEVVAFDLNQQTLQSINQKGIATTDSIEQLVHALRGRRVIWMMIPAGEAVDLTIQEIVPLLRSGDVLIDGGNSNYRETVRRAGALREKSMHYVDAGTSGGAIVCSLRLRTGRCRKMERGHERTH